MSFCKDVATAVLSEVERSVNGLFCACRICLGT